MAKVLKYKILATEVDEGTEYQPLILNKSMTWSEKNEQIAKREAYKGEYTIEDDGEPEPVAEPTPEQRLAELEEALALLLSGVTE